MQIVTKYRHSTGVSHVRVTTTAIPIVDSSKEPGLSQVRGSFDQEATTTLMARLAVFKAELEYAVDILRWIDRMLIKLMAKFANYTKGSPDSFSLPPEFAYYPQFMFYLRRSQFLQVFNSSPDETAFFRMILQRENVSNTIIMIQPMLMAYSLDSAPIPVLLDVSSATSDRILLLDTFFHVVLWYGETIAKWRDEKYHESPEFAHFAEMLQAPEADLQAIKESRFPVPLRAVSDQGGSQQRYLMAKLNPSVTHNSPSGYGSGGAPMVFTDDVNLSVFMEHLRKLSVEG